MVPTKSRAITPRFARVLQSFRLERKPAGPSHWRGPGSIPEASEVWVRRFEALPRSPAWSRPQHRRDIGRPPHSSPRAERRADFFPRPLQIFDQIELCMLFLTLLERRFLLFLIKFDQVELYVLFLKCSIRNTFPPLARRELRAPAPAAEHSWAQWAAPLGFPSPPIHKLATAGRSGYSVKCARIWRPVCWHPQCHSVRGPGWPTLLAFKVLHR